LLYFFNQFFADRKNANPVANVLWEQEATQVRKNTGSKLRLHANEREEIKCPVAKIFLEIGAKQVLISVAESVNE
jgi:hypothetical protein